MLPLRPLDNLMGVDGASNQAATRKRRSALYPIQPTNTVIPIAKAGGVGMGSAGKFITSAVAVRAWEETRTVLPEAEGSDIKSD